jgi:hypothetical protein
LTVNTRLLAACAAVLLFCARGVGECAETGTVPRETPPTPLQTVSTAAFSDGGYFAFIEPALCDEDENTFFLTAPHWDEGAPPESAPSPRDVVRVSSDGKKRMTFSPQKGSQFATATELKTLAIALDRDGALYMLIWAVWRDSPAKPEKNGQSDKPEKNGQSDKPERNGQSDKPERNGQYIVSFDRKGEYRSHLEVDWHQMLVSQFEVFGSGEFLLRGRRVEPSESRLAILSASGTTLQDVSVFSGRPLDEPPLEDPPQARFDRMVRGGDGRIYVTQEDGAGEGDVVYAISAAGDTERLFKLPRMPKDPPLVAWKAARDRFAASYRAERSAGDRTDRWWAAVYDSASDGGEPEATVYGPAPGPLLCYQRARSGDRFTFLDGSRFVTMSAR